MTELNLEQIYADAEERRKVIASENHADENAITEIRARIHARRAEDDKLARLLRSREPRTVTRRSAAAATPAAEGSAKSRKAKTEVVEPEGDAV